MATFVKYEQFVADLCAGVHDLQTAGSTLNVALTNTAPTVTTDAVLTNITELGTAGGYTAKGQDTTNTGSETTGTFTVAGTDVVWTATAAGIGPFRYVVLYNDTPATPLDPLIGYWDYGSSITLASGETFTVDFGASIFTVV